MCLPFAIGHFWIAVYLYIQNESCCTTFHVEMSFICKTINAEEELISMWKVAHEDSSWNWCNTNSEMAYFSSVPGRTRPRLSRYIGGC